MACAKQHRHCFSVEFDQIIYDRHLAFMEDIPISPKAINIDALDENTNWEQYEP